ANCPRCCSAAASAKQTAATRARKAATSATRDGAHRRRPRVGLGPAIDTLAAPPADGPHEADQADDADHHVVDDLEAEQSAAARRADPRGGLGPAGDPALAPEALADPDRAAVRSVPDAVKGGHTEERPQHAAI